MQYLIRLTDASAQRMVVLTLDETVARAPAIDVVFDIVGHENADELVNADILAAGQIDDFKALQHIVFERDAQGPFIRDGIEFMVNGRELDPDAPLISAFVPAEREGSKYMRCDLVVAGGPQAEAKVVPVAAAAGSSSEDMIKEFARILFLHEISIGFAIDVTKDFPELTEVIKYAESKAWVEVDVKKVAYKLTAEGQKVHDKYIAEAQDLIRRFDIYADVDVDSSARARFDTGLGRDLRIPAFEMEGVDPFRARFLLGLNDGEWDQLSNWMELFEDPKWYAEMFDPIERAPSVEEIGRERMASIIDQAKSALREQSQQQQQY